MNKSNEIKLLIKETVRYKAENFACKLLQLAAEDHEDDPDAPREEIVDRFKGYLQEVHEEYAQHGEDLLEQVADLIAEELGCVETDSPSGS